MSDNDSQNRQDRQDRPFKDDEPTIFAILEQTRKAAKGETTYVGDAIEQLGQGSFAALTLLPALLAVTPLSGIPAASSLLGLTIALVSVQVLMGRSHMWFPNWLLRRKVNSEKLRNALTYLQGPANWIDRHTKPRLTFLVRPPFRILLQVTCLVCGLTMPFLELIPFSSSALGAAVTLFATALLVRDGLLAAIGLGFLAGAITLITRFIFW